MCFLAGRVVTTAAILGSGYYSDKSNIIYQYIEKS